MKRGGWVAWVGALLVAVPSGWSEPPPESRSTDLRATAAEPVATAPASVNGAIPSSENGLVQMRFGPAVSKSRRLKVKLRAAFLMALDSIRRGAECRALFAPLEVDGVEMLTRSIYARATAGMEATWCRHAVAGTSVGRRTVFLCRRFATLPVEEASAILIHEAMHWAGMSESHLEQGCLTGDEISSNVRRACFPGDDTGPVMVASLEQEQTEHAHPAGSVRAVPSAVRVARTSPISMSRMTSRLVGVVDMRSSLPY